MNDGNNTLENQQSQTYTIVKCLEKQKKRTHVQLVMTLLELTFISSYVLKIDSNGDVFIASRNFLQYKSLFGMNLKQVR